MTVTNAVGDGMFVSTSMLFFTKILAFSPGSVSWALAIAGLVAIAAGIPVGKLADRFDGRLLLVALPLCEGTAVASYALVHNYLAFAVATCVAITAMRATPGVRNAYIARAEPGPERVQLRALLRSVMHIGRASGAALSSLILILSASRTSYVAIVLADGVTFLAAAAIYTRLPAQTAVLRQRARLREVLANRPFVLATIAESALSMNETLLQIALPLWVVTRIGLHDWVVSALIAISALLCILAQVPAARGITTPDRAGRAARRAGYLLALACLLYALAQGDMSSALVFTLLLVATLVRAASEVVQLASAWELAFALAPVSKAGLYQGFFSTGYSGALVIAPLAWTAVATRHDSLGWIAFAAVFVASGHVALVAARLADRHAPMSPAKKLARTAGGDSHVEDEPLRTRTRSADARA